MKLGVCTSPENIEKAAQAGFDYVTLYQNRRPMLIPIEE